MTYVLYSPCVGLAHVQAELPAGWQPLGPATPFSPGPHPALGCENGEMGTQGLPGSIHGSQKFSTQRVKGREDGERSGLHVILLTSSVFPCAEQWPAGKRSPRARGEHGQESQHNGQYSHAKLPSASQTAAPGVGDKGVPEPCQGWTSSPALPAACSPQGCCAHRGRASAELCCRCRTTAQHKDRCRTGQQHRWLHRAPGEPGLLRSATLTASAVTFAGPRNMIIIAKGSNLSVLINTRPDNLPHVKLVRASEAHYY